MDSIMKNIVNQIKEAVCNMKPQFTCACKNKTTELLVDNSINNEISCAISTSIANSQTQKEHKTASITEIAEHVPHNVNQDEAVNKINCDIKSKNINK